MPIEELFLSFLQKEISIVLENKTIKQGKLLLFCVKDFYLNFTLLSNSVIKTFELPYPFFTKMESISSANLLLDYKTNTLFRTAPTIKNNILFASKDKHMKFYNNIVKIIETV